MDQDAGRPCMDSLSCDTRISWHEEYQSQPASASDELCNNDKCSKQDERNGKDASPLDVSEVLRRWTHALKRIHKQALRLVMISTCLFAQIEYKFPRSIAEDSVYPSGSTFSLFA